MDPSGPPQHSSFNGNDPVLQSQMAVSHSGFAVPDPSLGFPNYPHSAQENFGSTDSTQTQDHPHSYFAHMSRETAQENPDFQPGDGASEARSSWNSSVGAGLGHRYQYGSAHDMHSSGLAPYRSQNPENTGHRHGLVRYPSHSGFLQQASTFFYRPVSARERHMGLPIPSIPAIRLNRRGHIHLFPTSVSRERSIG